jgi:hypothetical protein
MPDIEWVSLYLAIAQLENLWRIPQLIAEQIVRNVVDGGKVEVRGIPRYQLIPKIITGQIRLLPNSLFAPDYEDIEIDWNGLLVNGRMLVPSWIHVASGKDRRATPNKSPSSKGRVQRRGPSPGTIDRYNDEALFAQIDQMINGGRMSVNAAALKLANDGKVEGIGVPDSRARRLAKRYRGRRNSLPLASTRSD